MSTKPPTAVMMPRVSSSGFKSVLDLFQAIGMKAELFRLGILRLGEQGPDLLAVAAVGLGQRRGCGLQLFAYVRAHRARVVRAQPALARLLIDHRPFGGERPRLGNILQVRLGTLRT